jgi:hypothetical protein
LAFNFLSTTSQVHRKAILLPPSSTLAQYVEVVSESNIASFLLVLVRPSWSLLCRLFWLSKTPCLWSSTPLMRCWAGVYTSFSLPRVAHFSDLNQSVLGL